MRGMGIMTATLVAGLAVGARANDSTATLGAGGLQLTTTDDIAMVSEDLTISVHQIEVHYVFRNTSDQDITTVVAFPLPDIDMQRFTYEPVSAQSTDPVNFVDFRVTIDGAAVTPTLEQKAILTADGTDITAMLEAAGAPLSVFEPDWWDRIVALPDAVKAKLQARGILDWNAEYQEIDPNWTLKTTYWWNQTFPAGKTVTVDHVYKPVAGGSFFSSWDIDDPERLAYWQSAYCVDQGTADGLRRMLREVGPDQLLQAWAVDYILVTGANWAGDIGTFHLTVDKGDPHAIVSLCAPDIRKTGPTTFELTRTDYWPQRNLSIVVIEKPQAQ